MDVADLLRLPPRARFSERLSKKVLREQIGGGGGTSEARLLDKAVASARVVGVLRPETIQVPAHRQADREVTDIAVLHVEPTRGTTAGERRRLVKLVQRAMPRPVVLLLDGPGQPAQLSLALTHINRTDPERQTSVIDADITVPVDDLHPDGLSLARCDHTDLWALYGDLVRLAASGGRPAGVRLSAEEAVELHHRLRAQETELDALVLDARRAPAQRDRIALNTKAKALRNSVTTLRDRLYSSDSIEH
ncbi:Methyl-accepting chemotaxis protein [Pseudonocardia sp. Ae168_Ps1]|uniref:DUF4391 domain-containing protein n=1 Tax=unclassified Pseudonocardia TaxID=2619320 RepID=UPI0009601249|nr:MULTISPECIES: DUF4391 domain-containing protein [unclassified Pseudonocardia]OLL72874.1 Methyl-accepting chemotaxis protein [Pseudonocardia sp. Ae150A_Ps1]OLL78848.1 Methyl-accepting chemotaxis protein [Pseudonocardia sp. Ae168_Ps1]OLL87025.1 Methyl-accepting chemotaxis protein [Pseudonocardia sp. Ae263_Ps1]OLL92944.1 Methyl-accepting chemotaxis protein [Pseudonocardia sp. Ae356_Ps1]